MISVVILTFNEASNLPRCLDSVNWSDDVLLVDSGSTDGTCELAKSRGARIIVRPFDNFADQRNYALDRGALKHHWVLHLDADEVVTPELREEMLTIARSPRLKSGYRVPSRLMLMGQWLKHSGMYPTYQVRFGLRALRFHMVGHGQRELLKPEEVGTLKGDLIHYNFSHGISVWIAKHARYARDEAGLAAAGSRYRWADVFRAADPVERRRAVKELSLRLPLRPLARFAYVYLFRKGFLDGRVGFRYAVLMAFYQWAIDMNLAEIRQEQTEGTK